LIRALKNPDKSFNFDTTVLNSQDSNMMTFTIKNY
jgi:NAD(P)H-flavin reductase